MWGRAPSPVQAERRSATLVWGGHSCPPPLTFWGDDRRGAPRFAVFETFVIPSGARRSRSELRAKSRDLLFQAQPTISISTRRVESHPSQS